MPQDVLHAATDPRLRRAVQTPGGRYRVIAPHAVKKGERIFMNGNLHIEKAVTNGLGELSWLPVSVIERPKVTEVDDHYRSIYWLLAGDGCE